VYTVARRSRSAVVACDSDDLTNADVNESIVEITGGLVVDGCLWRMGLSMVDGQRRSCFAMGVALG